MQGVNHLNILICLLFRCVKCIFWGLLQLFTHQFVLFSAFITRLFCSATDVSNLYLLDKLLIILQTVYIAGSRMTLIVVIHVFGPNCPFRFWCERGRAHMRMPRKLHSSCFPQVFKLLLKHLNMLKTNILIIYR